MIEIICARCSARKMRNSGEVNRARRSGRPLYCSHHCFNESRRVEVRAAGWFERRFERRDTAVEVACRGCRQPMWLPPSKVAMHSTCSAACAKTARLAPIEARKRPCVTCGETFTPRQVQINNGGGRYCSHRCQPSAHLSEPDAIAYAHQRRRENQAAGLIKWKTGADHHAWTGGKEASQARQREPEKRQQQAAALRTYRAKNPHKIREWRQHRGKGKVLPRLPWGTIPRIGQAQRWKCAICRANVRHAYHVDHIQPIAKGGKHEPRNLQLLCQSCNVRKSAKDPISYMQELGRLL